MEVTNVKKWILLAIRNLLTVFLLVICGYIGYRLEYWQELARFDNAIGTIPVILLISATALLIILVWKKHKRALMSTVAIIAAAVMSILLFFPAVTGNWYWGRDAFGDSKQSNSLVSAEETDIVELEEKAKITIAKPLPTMDGATALHPLYTAFANAVYENSDLSEVVVCTNTPSAYDRIIAGDCDVIFVAGPSENQKKQAKEAGVDLVLTPIGKEAFVFLVGKSNPIEGLTQQQLKNIYSGKTANWKTVGWDAGGKMIVYQRPDGSGSQTGLQNIMGRLPIQKPQALPDSGLVGDGSMMRQVSIEWGGVQPAIGYSYRYYATTMLPNPDAKLLAIEGVYPEVQTIADGTYPFASNFYAVTNQEPKGNTKELIDWILSNEGQAIIERVGYVPLET